MSKVNMAVELSKSSVDTAELFVPPSQIDKEAVEYLGHHGCHKTLQVCEVIENKFEKCNVGVELHCIGGPSGSWVGVLPYTPAKSLFYTALICYIPAEDTYLIQSLRINRDRDIPYKYDKCSDYSLRTMSVVAKRPEKVARLNKNSLYLCSSNSSGVPITEAVFDASSTTFRSIRNAISIM